MLHTSEPVYNNIMKINKDTWKVIIQTFISILSAVLTTLGVSSCS